MFLRDARHMNAGAIAGLAIMASSEAATLARIEPFYSWNTPICWTGFILFADSLVWRARGHSWLRSSRREFVFLALVSIPLWLVFEFYNRFIHNWHYTGLPENWWLRMFGYAWAFATIWPAIFEGADLVAIARAGGAGGAGTAGGTGGAGWSRRAQAVSMAVGALMLVVPFLVSSEVARYMAAPVWLGFIFLLEPINIRLGGESIAPRRDLNRLWNLIASGFLCGVLWEFWNYWSGAKWHYTVPIMENMKIFEMPLPGYFGFPAFAVECFTMYVLVRQVLGRFVAPARTTRTGAAPVGRPIAL
jgi:hypothetical protein